MYFVVVIVTVLDIINDLFLLCLIKHRCENKSKRHTLHHGHFSQKGKERGCDGCTWVRVCVRTFWLFDVSAKNYKMIGILIVLVLPVLSQLLKLDDDGMEQWNNSGVE